MTQPWKIGVIMSQSGVTGTIERNQLAATKLAIAEINAMGGVCGRMIEAIYRDPKSTPALYRSHAQDLCRAERVQVIFGGHMSSTRKAMLPEIEAHNALLFYPTLYEGFEYSRHCVYTGAAPNQNSVPLVDYLSRSHGDRLFLVGSDYVYPYESNCIVADLLRAKGGRVVDEIYVPLEARPEHIAMIIERIREHQPNMIYSTVVGDGIVPFYTAYRDAGFDAKRCPIASQSTSEVDVALMPAGVAEGHLIAAPFFDTLRSPAATAFARAFRLAAGGPNPATAPAEAASCPRFTRLMWTRRRALCGWIGSPTTPIFGRAWRAFARARPMRSSAPPARAWPPTPIWSKSRAKRPRALTFSPLIWPVREVRDELCVFERTAQSQRGCAASAG